MDTLRQEKTCPSVPEIMKAPARQPRPLKRPLEAMRHGRRVEWVADAVAEDQIRNRVAPAAPREQPILELPDAVFSKGFDNHRVDAERPSSAGGLRLHQPPLAAHPLELCANRDGHRVEVDVPPAQAEQLALPQPRAEGGDVQRLQRVPADAGDEF